MHPTFLDCSQILFSKLIKFIHSFVVVNLKALGATIKYLLYIKSSDLDISYADCITMCIIEENSLLNLSL